MPYMVAYMLKCILNRLLFRDKYNLIQLLPQKSHIIKVYKSLESHLTERSQEATEFTKKCIKVRKNRDLIKILKNNSPELKKMLKKILVICFIKVFYSEKVKGFILP